jgi:serine/threonine protein kinase
VRGFSQEHLILQHIRRLRALGKPYSNYVAPLIGSFSLYGLYIILPSLRPISDIFGHRDVGGTALRLSLQLASGVQFLHDHHIAHLDIKPDNLGLTTDWVLQIIDFGLSVFVLDDDQLMLGKRGTEGFMAPEILNNTLYSPIRADRYSCGHVFLYFAKHSYKRERLHAFAVKLTSKEPLQRPALQRWVEQFYEDLFLDHPFL